MKLFRKDSPEVTITVLRAAFSDVEDVVEVELLHSRTDALLSELEGLGESVPRRDRARMSGREFCQRLVSDQLLGLSANSNTYSLAPAAVEALEILERVGSDRALANSSRIEAILRAARDLAALATVDPLQRTKQLDREIERLQREVVRAAAERDRIAAGGQVETAPEQQLIDAYAHLDDLIKRLPADLARVRDSVDGEHRRLTRELRDGDQSTGQSIIDHLATADLLLDTPEGKAFRGVRDLLGDRDTLRELRTNILAAVNHEVLQIGLREDERRDLTATHRRLREGLRTVQERRDRTAETLSGYVITRSLIEERELGRILDQLLGHLSAWLQTATNRTVLPWELIPEGIEIESIPERFDLTFTETPPPPLEDTSQFAPPPPTLEDILALGGPRPETLAAVVDMLRNNRDEQATLGSLFNQLPPRLRRPVELFGLWQAAAGAGADITAAPTEPFHTVRPDGSECTILAAPIVLTDAQFLTLLEKANDR
ncbi:hypothetical protein GTC6_11251 [Gordonia terrae C-6]|uniref:DUF3375 domain-containing protein n=1 Tax=Gordonia terrae C-6 TaxID=1316928 RepID=R7Y9E1_9ACTN|nr:hypothetical protein GTC6_11251 [Gordonia terrae C-6]